MSSAQPDPSGQENAPGRRVETSADSIVSEFLSKHISAHRKLVKLRTDGWNNPKAAMHFVEERASADNPTESGKQKFYEMTCKIGDDLLTLLYGPRRIVVSPASQAPKSISVLDLCMAPGGFSTAVLDRSSNDDVSIHGVTLPESLGGHPVRIPNWDKRIADIQFLDVTMLASEMGITSADEIPALHPDKKSFILQPLFADRGPKFDMIFCGGAVVRNHTEHETFQSYRGGSERTRLLTAQLVIAMNYIREGGTIVALLHNADTWRSATLFHTFSKFSDARKMKLFKPREAHARKGSFYLVVRGIDPANVAVKKAVKGWKEEWKIASALTGTDFVTHNHQSGDGGDPSNIASESSASVQSKDDAKDVEAAKALLEVFGGRLVQLTRAVFEIQAEALQTAPWTASRPHKGSWRNMEK
ncbi:hypothetical protein V8F20_001243 [Naviculisporaceae sp. PSN 640]